MDLKSLIESGLLEAYVLGQCSAEERALVERMAAEHAELRSELAAIEAALERYAAANAVQPPEGLKERILERIDAEAGPAPTKGKGNGFLRIFPIIAFLSVAAASFLFLKHKDLEQENRRLQIHADSLELQLTAANAALQKPDPVAALLCDPETKRILVSDGKGISTIVYYNTRLNQMTYDPYGLPTPKPGKYFQFWAIVDGKPKSLGMVQGASLCASLQNVENAVAFAISEEDKPEGNPAPTLVLAIGKV